MKYLFIILASLFIVVDSCQAQEAGVKLANDWIAALNKHDLSSILNFYTDSVQAESPNWEGVKKGKAGIQEVYSRYFAGTPDLLFETTNIIVAKNAIVIEYTSTGTFSNPEQGTPDYMKGKKYTLKNSTRFDLQDGKILKQVSYFDQVSFLRQVGFFDQK